MMAELRARKIIESDNGSWCEPGEAVGIASELWGPPRNDFEAASFYVSAEPLVDHDLVSASLKPRPVSEPRPSRDCSPSTIDEEIEEQAQVNAWFVNAFRNLAKNRKRAYSAHAQMLRRKAKHGHLFKDQLDASTVETGDQAAASAGLGHRLTAVATRVGNTIIPDAVHPSMEEQLFGEDLEQRRMRRSLREMKEIFSISGAERPRSSNSGRPLRRFSQRHRWDGRTRYPSFDADGNPYLPGTHDTGSPEDVDDSEDELSSYNGDDNESNNGDGGDNSDGRDEGDDTEQSPDNAGGGASGDGDGSDGSDQGSDRGRSSDNLSETDDADTENEEEVSEESAADADAVDAAVSELRHVKTFDDLLRYERAVHVHSNWPEEDPDAYDSEVDSDRVPTSSASRPASPANASARPTTPQSANAVAGPRTVPPKRGRPRKNKDGGTASTAALPAQKGSSAADPQDADEPPHKRRPGRPRKSGDVDPPPTAPKRRGRPPKDKGANSAPGSPEEPPKKRKPGRPRKEKDADPTPNLPDEPLKKLDPSRPRQDKDTDTAPTASGEPPEKRRPGRPRKSEKSDPGPTIPKKRGRPPKDKDKGKQRADDDDDDEDELATPKRPRCKPREAGNTTEAEPEELDPPQAGSPASRPRQGMDGVEVPSKFVPRPVRQFIDCIEIPSRRLNRQSSPDAVPRPVQAPADDSTPAKRPRGRPRKKPVPDPEPPRSEQPGLSIGELQKRGRGRPRKHPLREADDSADQPGPSIAPLSQKRRRKSPVRESEPEEVPEQEAALPPQKRPRGRPRKNPGPEEVPEQEVAVPPQKRPRGRPRKNPGPEKRTGPSAPAAPAALAESSVSSASPPVTRRQGPTWATHNGHPVSATPPTARNADEESMDELQDSPEVPLKRGRGRPKGRKNRSPSADEPMPLAKRKRGRPPKSNPESAAVADGPPEKRKPGRPRKTDPGPATAGLPAKRKPGRPRKTEPLPQAPGPEGSDREAPAKRGRGRPKGSTNYASALSQALTPRVTRSTPYAAPGPSVGSVRETRSTAYATSGSPLARRNTRSDGASHAELAAMYPAYYDAESKGDEFYDRMNRRMAEQDDDRKSKDNDGSYAPDGDGDDDEDDDLYT